MVLERTEISLEHVEAISYQGQRSYRISDYELDEEEDCVDHEQGPNLCSALHCLLTIGWNEVWDAIQNKILEKSVSKR